MTNLPCAMKPEDRKNMVGQTGQRLIQEYGRHPYYTPYQIRTVADALGFAVDVHCWLYCVFCSAEVFAALHQAAGEACDYATMRAEVLLELTSGNGFDWADVNLSWLDWPDIDFASIFDWFDWG